MDGVTGLWPQALRSDVAAFPHPLWLPVLVGSALQRAPIWAIRPPQRARSGVLSVSVITPPRDPSCRRRTFHCQASNPAILLPLFHTRCGMMPNQPVDRWTRP
jgi:hypothetical protein